jgi:vancomycin resistance protein VanW
VQRRPRRPLASVAGAAAALALAVAAAAVMAARSGAHPQGRRNAVAPPAGSVATHLADRLRSELTAWLARRGPVAGTPGPRAAAPAPSTPGNPNPSPRPRPAPPTVAVCGRLASPTAPLAASPPGDNGDSVTADRPETGDAFDQPRGPRSFHPDEAAFAALLERERTPIRMAVFSTNFYHARPSQEANIALVARRLTGVVIPPGGVFSFNRTAGPYTEANGYGLGRMFVGDRIVPTIGGGVCQGASTLYNVVLLAGLEVVERYPHGLLVPYLPPGRDATVTDEGGLDFRFRNTSGGPVVLWAQAENRWLTVALYGRKAPPRVVIHTDVLEWYPFATRYVEDPALPAGTEEVVAPGQPGCRVRTWLTVTSPDGASKRRLLGEDRYAPSPRIIRRGTGPAGGARASGPPPRGG